MQLNGLVSWTLTSIWIILLETVAQLLHAYYDVTYWRKSVSMCVKAVCTIGHVIELLCQWDVSPLYEVHVHVSGFSTVLLSSSLLYLYWHGRQTNDEEQRFVLCSWFYRPENPGSGALFLLGLSCCVESKKARVWTRSRQCRNTWGWVNQQAQRLLCESNSAFTSDVVHRAAATVRLIVGLFVTPRLCAFPPSL